MNVSVRLERWPFAYPFKITGYDWTESVVAVVEVESDGLVGRGECAGVYYKGDTAERCSREIKRVAPAIASGLGRKPLLEMLPAGGARNALDCALWELESKQRGVPVWELAGLPPPRPVLTTFTVGADDSQVMAKRAREFDGARALKLKLTGDDRDGDRVRAVRQACPDAWLSVDANCGFSPDSLRELLPVLLEAGVRLVEQPFPVGCESALDGLHSPIPIAADESFQDLDDLQKLTGRFDVVNIKLDKCGGLTRALQIERTARSLGFGVMAGNMCGTSLAMAPAFLLAQRCDVVDLDGPLLLGADREHAAYYDDGLVWCDESVWGGRALDEVNTKN